MNDRKDDLQYRANMNIISENVFNKRIVILSSVLVILFYLSLLLLVFLPGNDEFSGIQEDYFPLTVLFSLSTISLIIIMVFSA